MPRGLHARNAPKPPLDYLDDRQRTYLTSPFVRLETVPKAEYPGRSEELSFYESFFKDPGVEWCRDWAQMEANCRGRGA
jgi:hypothetical protein